MQQDPRIDQVLGLNRAVKFRSSRVTEWDRRLVRKLLDFIGSPPFAIKLWDDQVILPKKGEAIATVVIHDRPALIGLLWDAELHFGDLYSTGRVEIEGELVRFLEVGYQSLRRSTSGDLSRLLKRWRNRPHANSARDSRHNIYHHYDIGNAFYKLWLDKAAMQYTCAYFPDPDMTLEQAQLAKLHHICRKLQLKPGDTVVEAGCGWGGLARFMAKHYGVTVKAYNVSHEQILYARERAAEEGLTGWVDYIEDDYRNISGLYDVFVSVGMLEHVGTRHYGELGRVIVRCLKPDGRGLIHSIGRIRPALMNAWIEKRIFPGGYPPSLGEMMQIFEPHELVVQDVENLRLHYAKTLRHWLDRFEECLAKVIEMFDETFARAWRLYLAGSIASFTVNELQLYQVVFTGRERNNLPWSRQYLYQQPYGVEG